MSDSTIGYPVVIPVVFSLPSSTVMTLFLTVAQESNQTLAQYSPSLANFTITPRIISIQAQTTAYNFIISQGAQIVPPPLTLNFKLTSNYPIVHQLTTPTMYLCFDRDPKHNVLYPPLRVTVTAFLTSCNLQDVGKSVTNIMISNSTSQSSAASVTPKVIQINVTEVASTGAILQVSSISASSIYYLCIPAGYPTVTQASTLVAMSNPQGVKGVSPSAALTIASGSTGQINYIANITLSGLSQTSNYVFYAVSSNNLGTSAIVSIMFNTTALSNGAQMTLKFTTIVATLDLVQALVQVLRISPTRVKVLTSIYKLQQQQAAITINDNRNTYSYDVVIAPDPSNDVVSPLATVQNFVSNTATLATFQTYLTSFVYSSPIKYFEIMPSLPIIVVMPYLINLQYYKGTFGIKFKAQATIYAVLI
jgi:hypothetical protein